MNESNILGVSVRAIIAIELVTAVVCLAFLKFPVDETLKYLAVSAVSFYFGTKQQGGTNGTTTKVSSDPSGTTVDTTVSKS